MDFSPQIEANRRALLQDVFRRIEAALSPFRSQLDGLLAALIHEGLSEGWRERWHAFVAEQSALGIQIAPASVIEIEEWLEDFAHGSRSVVSANRGEVPSEIQLRPAIGAADSQSKRSRSPFMLAGYPSRRGKRPREESGKGHSSRGRNRGKSSDAPPTSTKGVGVMTKTHLPASWRGTWVKGTRGNGVFRFNNNAANRLAGIAGKEVRFRNQHIAVGGFPAEAYYQGSAAEASVKISNVTGTGSDSAAADAAMRRRLRNPKWMRPEGYVWNHAGEPGSTVMELIKEKFHRAIAHKGPASVLRAFGRAVKGQGAGGKKSTAKGATGRAMGALSVYLTVRDALQAAGILQPDFHVQTKADYYFVAADGSVFIVWQGGWFSRNKLEFVAGPRAGQTETISEAEVQRYNSLAEKVWGKYIPGSLLRQPRFIPGTKRETIPVTQDIGGVPKEIGWIDEDGVHYYDVPLDRFI